MTGRRLFILGNSFSKPIPLNPFPFLYIPQFSRFTLLVYLTLSQVVEDNAINQLVTRGMLLKLGYRVRTADNGSEALELLARERPDGVLLDCQMPVMDGFATCRAIRALPGCAELPVLALTAHSHSGDRERCLAAGMSDYMAKPVKFEELQTLLHDWLLCQPIVTKSA